MDATAAAKEQIKAYADGKLVPATKFGLPAMNFGQPRPGSKLVSYELVIPLEAFLVLLGPRFDQFVTEVREDDEGEDDPQLLELKALDYPALQSLARDQPALLGSLVRRWLRLETLDLCSDNSPGPGFAFNSLDAVTVLALPDEVRLAGRAFVID